MPWGYTFRDMPERVQNQSNSRVNLSVHLRIRGLGPCFHCFGTVLALFGTVLGMALPRFSCECLIFKVFLRSGTCTDQLGGEVLRQRSGPRKPAGLEWVVSGPECAIPVWDIPWVGPWQYHGVPSQYTPVHPPSIPRVHPPRHRTQHAVPQMAWDIDLNA